VPGNSRPPPGAPHVPHAGRPRLSLPFHELYVGLASYPTQRVVAPWNDTTPLPFTWTEDLHCHRHRPRHGKTQTAPVTGRMKSARVSHKTAVAYLGGVVHHGTQAAVGQPERTR
jgi:hypothetical protein